LASNGPCLSRFCPGFYRLGDHGIDPVILLVQLLVAVLVLGWLVPVFVTVLVLGWLAQVLLPVLVWVSIGHRIGSGVCHGSPGVIWSRCRLVSVLEIRDIGSGVFRGIGPGVGQGISSGVRHGISSGVCRDIIPVLSRYYPGHGIRFQCWWLY